MIYTKELRRLAQAATPGPWASQGRYIGTPRHMSYIGEVRDQCGNWSDTEKSRADSAFIAAANPAAINDLLDRLEAAEKDIALKERIIDSLGSELNAVANERDDLLARIREMERQEPVAWLHETRRDSDVVTNAVKHVWGKAVVGSLAAYSIPLYLAPDAKGE